MLRYETNIRVEIRLVKHSQLGNIPERSAVGENGAKKLCLFLSTPSSETKRAETHHDIALPDAFEISEAGNRYTGLTSATSKTYALAMLKQV